MVIKIIRVKIAHPAGITPEAVSSLLVSVAIKYNIAACKAIGNSNALAFNYRIPVIDQVDIHDAAQSRWLVFFNGYISFKPNGIANSIVRFICMQVNFLDR